MSLDYISFPEWHPKDYLKLVLHHYVEDVEGINWIVDVFNWIEQYIRNSPTCWDCSYRIKTESYGLNQIKGNQAVWAGTMGWEPAPGNFPGGHKF